MSQPDEEGSDNGDNQGQVGAFQEEANKKRQNKEEGVSAY